MRYRWTSESGEVLEVVRSIADRDVKPTAEEIAEAGFYWTEDTEIWRKPEAPFRSLANKAIERKGYRKVTKAEIAESMEVSQLEQEAMNMAEDNVAREEVAKEISKLSGEV